MTRPAPADSALEPVYVCSRCGERYSAGQAIWRCPNDGAVLNGWPAVAFSAADVDSREPGLWRYARALPPLPATERIRLG